MERLLDAMKSGKIGAQPKPDRLGLVGIQLQPARGTGDIRHTWSDGL